MDLTCDETLQLFPTDVWEDEMNPAGGGGWQERKWKSQEMVY